MFIKRPEIAEMARRLAVLLVGVNDEITDQRISQTLGHTVDPGSHVMRSALRELERGDPPVHFRRLRSYGWKRMHDQDLVAHSDADLKKIARGARRGRKRLGHIVQFDALSTGDQLRASTNNTRLAAIEDAAATVKVRAVPSSVPDLTSLLEKIKGAQG
jgi:hypothetical protein